MSDRMNPMSTLTQADLPCTVFYTATEEMAMQSITVTRMPTSYDQHFLGWLPLPALPRTPLHLCKFPLNVTLRDGSKAIVAGYNAEADDNYHLVGWLGGKGASWHITGAYAEDNTCSDDIISWEDQT